MSIASSDLVLKIETQKSTENPYENKKLNQKNDL